MWYSITRFLLHIVVPLLLPLRVTGRERLPKKGPCLIACNHQSYLDIPLLIYATKPKIHFIAKESLFTANKLIGWYFKKMLAFPVNRNSADLQAVRTALGVLKKGEVLGIFPQGTRQKHAPRINPEELYAGVAMMALRTGAPIVPCMYQRQPRIFRRNYLTVGEPFSFESRKTERLTPDLLQELTKELAARLNALLNDGVLSKSKTKETTQA